MLEFKVDEFNIRLIRLPESEDRLGKRNRLVQYVDKICELGEKYMPELRQDEFKTLTK
ncbi:hypothetical protein J6O48_12620 [bacterium]|nr:hypothetical protein [bacterium]